MLMLKIPVFWFFTFFTYSQCVEKFPYSRGTICNIEAFFNVRGRLSVNRFFCVPDSICRRGVHRLPLIDSDSCNSFMHSSNAEPLVCCHKEEILEDLANHFANLTYIPGLKSFMMCKEYSHAICGEEGSYCADDTAAQRYNGIATVISKYPHTALIGYYDSIKMAFNWFCLGSIVSKKYILTVWGCVAEDGKSATLVKLGESRLCDLDYCPDKGEEQSLQIKSISKQYPFSENSHDLVLLEVATIMFNKNVRPACLFYQLNTRESEGWFARYSKSESLIKTYPGRRPIFMIPKDENFTSFKVKTAGEVVIMLSKSGLPYRKEFYYQVILGSAGNTESTLTRSDAPNYKRPPTPTNITTNILSSEQFRGFWIHIRPHHIRVGKEDSMDPFLVYDDVDTDLDVYAMGISTPDSKGEWILNDYRVSTSLHDFELENTYTDECKDALGDSLGKEHEAEIKDSSIFCSRGYKRKLGGINFGPCNNDWGGAIQVTDERLFCMWQIFGVYLRESLRNCSIVDAPSLFKPPSLFRTLNNPKVLNWLEGMLFPDFNILDVNLRRPECVGSKKKNG